MRNTGFEWGSRTYVMGILNVTPDSFSGDGLLNTTGLLEAAIEQAVGFEEDGADILDIGGESTRPGSAPVDEEEEKRRILPVIREVRKHTTCIISVDTSKAAVAQAALEAGADWINDVWALQRDPQMPAVAAAADCPVALMHNRSKGEFVQLDPGLGGMYGAAEYTDVVHDVCADLQMLVNLALQRGIRAENIILDPGIGFGKSISQNMALINHLDDIRALGYPVLLGASRKSFIGFSQNLLPAERVEGSLAAAVVGIIRGADILRVHDVRETVRAARLADAIVRAK